MLFGNKWPLVFLKKFFIFACYFFFADYKMQLKSSAVARWFLFRVRAVCPFLFGQFTFLLSVRICSYTLASVVPSCFYSLQYLHLNYTHVLFLFLHLFYSHTIYIYIYVHTHRVAQKERMFLKWVVVGRLKVGNLPTLPQIKSLRSKTSYSRRSESFHSRRNCNCATRNVSKCDVELRGEAPDVCTARRTPSFWYNFP